jgi:hypothetical protein
MSSAPVMLRGTVSPLEGGPCRVALLDSNDQEWPIFPRGAGGDLAERVGSPVELLCSTMEGGADHQIYVRSYKFLDEAENDSWF